MIKEDYVSFETAKLLKEKGFDWQQSPFYSEQYMDEWKQENSYQIPNPDYDPNIPFDTETITMVAPHISQSLALKWLREVHNLHIWFGHSVNKGLAWYYEIHGISDGKVKHIGGIQCGSYEVACEAALKYTLENLI